MGRKVLCFQASQEPVCAMISVESLQQSRVTFTWMTEDRLSVCGSHDRPI